MKKFKKTLGYFFYPVTFIFMLLFGLCYIFQDWCDGSLDEPVDLKDNYKKEK